MITIFCTVVLSIDPGSSTLTQEFYLGKRWGVTTSLRKIKYQNITFLSFIQTYASYLQRIPPKIILLSQRFALQKVF
jgi:hypothetical protein